MFILLASVPFFGGDSITRERWLLPNGGRELWGDEPWAVASGDGPYERTLGGVENCHDYHWAPGAL